MRRVYLGPRASVLLNLLSRPLTVHELIREVEHAVFVADELDVRCEGGNPHIALRKLSDAGTPEVRHLLERLERMGLVSRLTLEGGAELWWRP